MEASTDLKGNKSFTISTAKIFPFIIKYPSICQYTADIYVLSLNRFPIYVIMHIGLQPSLGNEVGSFSISKYSSAW